MGYNQYENKEDSLMKKIITILFIAIALVACSTPTTVDHGYEKADMSEYLLLTTEDHSFATDDFDTIMTRIENMEKGIYYLGFSGCPWCKESVPVLENTLKENNQFAFYINTRSDEFTLELSTRWSAFEEALPDELRSLGYVPFVFSIDDDQTIRSHMGTIDSHNAQERLMTDEEAAELLEIYNVIVNID